MRLEVKFQQTSFPVSVLRSLYENWLRVNGIHAYDYFSLNLSRGDETWTFDDLEEFFGEYDRGFDSAKLYLSSGTGPNAPSLEFSQYPYGATAAAKSSERGKVLEVLAKLREVRDKYVVSYPEPPAEKPRIFMGHGRGSAWEKLYRHLKDQQRLDVFAFETEERAGQTIQAFLDEALTRANFAVMVMTGDDTTIDGSTRARQNVVHETGLFQGRLGSRRVLIVAEEGIESFSNTAGTQELRFEKDKIESVSGRLLAVLRDQFPQGL